MSEPSRQFLELADQLAGWFGLEAAGPVLYALVFVLAAVPWIEVLLVIPGGIAMGLHPLPVAVVAFAGNLLTVLPIIYMFERVFGTRRQASLSGGGRWQRAHRLLQRYGIPGLLLLGPLLTGSHVAAAIAMAARARPYLVLVWMAGSLALWSVVLGVASWYGLSWLARPSGM